MRTRSNLHPCPEISGDPYKYLMLRAPGGRVSKHVRPQCSQFFSQPLVCGNDGNLLISTDLFRVVLPECAGGRSLGGKRDEAEVAVILGIGGGHRSDAPARGALPAGLDQR